MYNINHKFIIIQLSNLWICTANDVKNIIIYILILKIIFTLAIYYLAFILFSSCIP